MNRQVAVRLLLLASVVALVSCTTTSKAKKQVKPKEAPKVLSQWPPKAVVTNFKPVVTRAETVLITNATLLTAIGEPVKNGSILLKDGKIAKVSAGKLEAPKGAKVIDGKGRYVTPGIIDIHSHLGVYASPGVWAHADGNEMTSPTTPQVAAVHSVWPQDPGFERALAGGVTALHILPGSANLIGGRTVSLQLHRGVSSHAMRFPGAPDGLKMACGENPKRVYGRKGRMPSTRMGNMAVFRSTFAKAARTKLMYEKYIKSLQKWAKDSGDEAKKPKPPKRDLAMETLVGVLRNEILVHVHCYRADEMVQLMELAKSNGFKIRAFHHAVEAYKIKDVLAQNSIAVATWADWWGFKIEAHDAVVQNAAMISQAKGGRAIIHSDSPLDVQRLNQEAAKAYFAAKHKGMPVTEDEALRWITLNPAWAMGVDKVTGSLEPGKRADVVLWSAHPFSVYAKAQMVWVEGVREYDASQKAKKPWSDFELGQQPKEIVEEPKQEAK